MSTVFFEFSIKIFMDLLARILYAKNPRGAIVFVICQDQFAKISGVGYNSPAASRVPEVAVVLSTCEMMG
jgi:hypothetical protein